MRHQDIFKAHIWLIETVRKNGPITLSEIKRLWKESSLFEGRTLHNSAFFRYRDNIDDIFGIRIEPTEKHGNKYCIQNPEVLEGEAVQNWMFNSLATSNLLSENKSIYDKILLESIPSQGEYFDLVLKALKHNTMVSLVYCKYQSDPEDERTIEPYCVKLYSRRWYLLGRLPEDGTFRVFSFDRIKSLSMTEQALTPDPEFSPTEYFKDCYGVARSENEPPVTVVLRAYGRQQFYMRDTKLHPSQRIIHTEGNEYTDFEYFIRPSQDFIGRILSCDQWLEVRSPQSLIDRIKESLNNMKNRYR